MPLEDEDGVAFGFFMEIVCDKNIVPCSGYFLRMNFPPGAIVSSSLVLQRQMGKGLKL
jgi:hypothetical protein